MPPILILDRSNAYKMEGRALMHAPVDTAGRVVDEDWCEVSEPTEQAQLARAALEVVEES